MTVGERLIEAFWESQQTRDKKKIAEMLGYTSEQSIYKILKGEREMNFDALKNFTFYTKRSIDWLLTGDKEKKTNVEVIKVIDLLGGKEYEEIEEQRLKWIENNDEDISLEDFLRELLIWGSVHELNEESKAEIESHFETEDYVSNTDYVLRRSIVEIVRTEINYGESREDIIKIIKEAFSEETKNEKNNRTNFEKNTPFKPNKRLSLNIDANEKYESEVEDSNLDRDLEKMKDDPE